jgi:hypothetical protein
MKENSDDMMRKGRKQQPKGQNNTCSKWTDEIVRWIRTSPNAKVLSGKELAAIFEVSPASVSIVRNGKHWPL